MAAAHERARLQAQPLRLADEEEGDEDVTDIIGDVGGDEET